MWDLKTAEAIRDKCLGKPGIVTEESKPTTQISPLLYDLTSLQREANGRFGFSAKNTLGLAQALYEKHKVLTYPRTDSRALPEDYIGTVKKTLGMLADVTGYSRFADKILKRGLGQAEQADFQQRENLGPFCHHPDGAGAEASERAGAEIIRPGDETVSGGIFSGGGIPGDDAHHRGWRRSRSRAKAR